MRVRGAGGRTMAVVWKAFGSNEAQSGDYQTKDAVEETRFAVLSVHAHSLSLLFIYLPVHKSLYLSKA
jgi:hypothetical protein